MNWRQKTLITGLIVGALAGLGAAQIYIRAIEDTGAEEPRRIKTGDALHMGFSLFGVIRQAAKLAS
jgi:hypothetical protein